MSKLRKSAKGRECTVRIPGICNFNPETTVLAHLNGAGMGLKHNDLFACLACSKCHAWLDYEYAKHFDREHRDNVHLQAILKTQRIWLEEGLIKVAE